MAEQEGSQGAGIGRDVEGLGGADPGQWARGDVAHRVAAGLARGDAHGGQPAHERGRIFDVNEVELEVLAGGDVGDAVRVFLGQLGQHFELARVDPAKRDLDALHAGGIPEGHGAFGQRAGRVDQALGLHAVPALAVVVALAVGAAAQAGFGEELLVEAPALAQLDLVFVDVDLTPEIGRERLGQRLFPGLITDLHSSLLKLRQSGRGTKTAQERTPGLLNSQACATPLQPPGSAYQKSRTRI